MAKVSLVDSKATITSGQILTMLLYIEHTWIQMHYDENYDCNQARDWEGTFVVIEHFEFNQE